jgi:hypothetical protein
MATARKFVVALASIRKPTKSFTADPETYLPPLQMDSEMIDRPNKREAIVLLFVGWSETARFPIVFTLKLLDLFSSFFGLRVQFFRRALSIHSGR